MASTYGHTVYRFLLQRRWLGLLLVVLVLGAVCVRLGLWQLDRRQERQADNDRITANLAAEPAAIDTLVTPGGVVPEVHEWRRVGITGVYDTDSQVLVRYQNRDQGRGVDVITPLVTDRGMAVLVDRGWLLGDSPAPEEIPAAPSGPVTVTGWLQPDSEAGDSATRPEQGQVRAVASTGIGPTLDYPTYPGYVALTQQSPATAGLEPAELPELDSGPHFFYGLQWFFFAGLAVFGWCCLAWVEAHPRRRIGDPLGVSTPATNAQ